MYILFSNRLHNKQKFQLHISISNLKVFTQSYHPLSFPFFFLFFCLYTYTYFQYKVFVTFPQLDSSLYTKAKSRTICVFPDSEYACQTITGFYLSRLTLLTLLIALCKTRPNLLWKDTAQGHRSHYLSGLNNSKSSPGFLYSLDSK